MFNFPACNDFDIVTLTISDRIIQARQHKIGEHGQPWIRIMARRPSNLKELRIITKDIVKIQLKIIIIFKKAGQQLQEKKYFFTVGRCINNFDIPTLNKKQKEIYIYFSPHLYGVYLVYYLLRDSKNKLISCQNLIG